MTKSEALKIIAADGASRDADGFRRGVTAAEVFDPLHQVYEQLLESLCVVVAAREANKVKSSHTKA